MYKINTKFDYYKTMISKFTFNNQYILTELSQEERDLLEKIMRNKKYAKNQAIFTEGTIPSGIFYVKSGKIKKIKVDNEGRQQIINIYNAGEFFGYSSVLGEQSYSDTTIAIENSIISYLPKAEFLKILNKSTTFSRLLLKSLSNEFNVMVNLIAILSQRTVRERIALSLLILYSKYKNDTDEIVLITLSRSDIANMAGTVKETLARVLHDFKNEKLIITEGRKIKLININKLIEIANFK